eukprot:1189746-Prorocentrum_minimum.AAC.4
MAGGGAMRRAQRCGSLYRVGTEGVPLMTGGSWMRTTNVSTRLLSVFVNVVQVFVNVVQVFGSEHPATATALNNLANHSVDDPDNAKELYTRSLNLRERLLVPEHPKVGSNGATSGIRNRNKSINHNIIIRRVPGVLRAPLPLLALSRRQIRERI